MRYSCLGALAVRAKGWDNFSETLGANHSWSSAELGQGQVEERLLNTSPQQEPLRMPLVAPPLGKLRQSLNLRVEAKSPGVSSSPAAM